MSSARVLVSLDPFQVILDLIKTLLSTEKIKIMKQQGDLLLGSLLVRESRLVATLILTASTEAVWTEQILARNILQKKSPATAARLTRGLRKRLSPLDKKLLQTLIDADDRLAKQIILTSILHANRLLLGFFKTVLADAYLNHQERLHLYQWDDYVMEYSRNDSSILLWSHTSLKKVRQIIIRILAESGYLSDTKNRRLQRVIVDPELQKTLEQLHMQEVLNGLRLRDGRR
jgi:hypothetical protein